MHGIARVNQDAAGGTILGGGQSFVTVEGALWAVKGDAVAGHGLAPHTAPVMAEGSPFVFINGIPACREGNLATCGHAASGSGAMRISE
jgi:uncharacterized Zn-binding protein involved in type VI secretion